MSKTLIIAEKPSAARKIAGALAEDTVKIKREQGVSYMEFTHGGERIVVAPAVGHLFGLAQKSSGWDYPVFDVEWRPTFETDRGASFSKKYYEALKILSAGADEFIVATDLDIEGETIAYNILRFICGTEHAKRMEFSTLTRPDLTKSFENMKPGINLGLAMAGVTRHTLDFFFGINVSRALTLSLKAAGRHKILSSGRVQGPALKLLTDRELEIKAFVSTPYWQAFMIGTAQAKDPEAAFRAIHEQGRFWNKEEADKVRKDCEGKEAWVSELAVTKQDLWPPTPFNLTDLQMESHRVFGINPKQTQSIAQSLYEAALISYPRTSSQKLPPAIGYKSIIAKLSKNPMYKDKAEFLLARAQTSGLSPRQGKKEDEAHPAIFPTGELPKEMSPWDAKVYDLIVKRFLATFGGLGEKETTSVTISCGARKDKAESPVKVHRFLLEGRKITREGWHELYAPYGWRDEARIPHFSEGQDVAFSEIDVVRKETEPPNRYNPATIIRELEKRELGTKSTRAEIVDSLYKRGYLKDTRIEVTDLGIKVVETLEKHCPEILSEDLTRRFEHEMDDIAHGKLKSESVVDEAKVELTKILLGFKKNEAQIGKSLLGAVESTEVKTSTIGQCDKCAEGKLRVMRSRKGGQFIGCTAYPKCHNIYPLPRIGKIEGLKTPCPDCGKPQVKIINRGRRPWSMCIDPQCKSKANWGKNGKSAKKDSAEEKAAGSSEFEKAKLPEKAEPVPKAKPKAKAKRKTAKAKKK